LIHDRVRLGVGHRRANRAWVERVEHDRLGAELAQPFGLLG
jgi:hypothetical protein